MNVKQVDCLSVCLSNWIVYILLIHIQNCSTLKHFFVFYFQWLFLFGWWCYPPTVIIIKLPSTFEKLHYIVKENHFGSVVSVIFRYRQTHTDPLTSLYGYKPMISFEYKLQKRFLADKFYSTNIVFSIIVNPKNEMLLIFLYIYSPCFQFFCQYQTYFFFIFLSKIMGL